MTVTLCDAPFADLDAAGALCAADLDLDLDDAREIPARLWTDHPGATAVRLAAYADGRLVGVLLGSIQGAQAYLDLIVVAEGWRRQGIGRSLLDEWHTRARGAHVRSLAVGGNLLGYAWPGVDIRYTAALCMLRGAGYELGQIVYNMDLVPSTALANPDERAAQLADVGIRVHRAGPDDRAAVEDYFVGRWSPEWRRECLIALGGTPSSLFLAIRGGEIVGFAAHGVHRVALYGPIASEPSVRGLGVGDALSRACLVDMAQRGVRRAQIGWVAETAIPFYSRTVGARLGRCFWMLVATVTQDPA